VISQTARLNRLFGQDGKCLVVALDHGSTGEPRAYQGLENLGAAVRVVAQSLPDAILLGPGQAHWLQEFPGRSKPSLLVRADVTSLYSRPGPDPLFCNLLEGALEQAVRADAVGVVANLLDLPDPAGIREQCLRNLSLLRACCERYGMPLMVETRHMRRSRRSGMCEPSGEVGHLGSLVRQAVELGADLIKSDRTGNPQEVDCLVEAASGKPLLILGGAVMEEKDMVRQTQAVLQRGISGLVYGRNVFSAPDPARRVRILMALLHEGGLPRDVGDPGLGQDPGGRDSGKQEGISRRGGRGPTGRGGR
jgi:DhnA family fructose-bisphosphate aldolase class Ia